VDTLQWPVGSCHRYNTTTTTTQSQTGLWRIPFGGQASRAVAGHGVVNLLRLPFCMGGRLWGLLIEAPTRKNRGISIT